MLLLLLMLQDSTSASLREKARKLQQEALVSRDQATCVRGAQQAFRLRVAEMREQEAARLLQLAQQQDTGGPPPGAPGAQGGPPEALFPTSSDHQQLQALNSNQYSDAPAAANGDSPTRNAHGVSQHLQQQLQQQQVLLLLQKGMLRLLLLRRCCSNKSGVATLLQVAGAATNLGKRFAAAAAAVL